MIVCGENDAVMAMENGEFNYFQLSPFNERSSFSSSIVPMEGAYVDSTFLFSVASNTSLFLYGGSNSGFQTGRAVPSGRMYF